MISLLVNGNWGTWPVSFGTCSASCGGGTQSKTRTCDNPVPSNGGLDCELSDGSGNRGSTENQSQACNIQGCPGMLIVFYIIGKCIYIIHYYLVVNAHC